MIILLTGRPGVGKSTAIDAFIKLYSEPATWVVTTAIPRPEGGRAGFLAANSNGLTMVISHKTDIDSNVIIGENHVDVAAVDTMFADALHHTQLNAHELTIVDEIGPIQLLSPAFSSVLERAFTTGADMVASIHHKEDRLAPYRTSPHAILLEVTIENRDFLPQALAILAHDRQAFNRLTLPQQKAAAELIHGYVDRGELLQVQKLMSNAIHYVAERKVMPIDTHRWRLTGKHGEYTVVRLETGFTCTCDLFNGRGKYQGKAGECSHIQAVKIAK